MVRDNFVHANRGHCCTCGDISDGSLQVCIIGGFLAHVDGIFAPVSTIWGEGEVYKGENIPGSGSFFCGVFTVDR